MNDAAQTKRYLDLAARCALRGFGFVEPNPMVGAVVVMGDQIIGIGHHTKFGALHAEREALGDCKRRGNDPRGATLYCTLEPCAHFGKQPPCTQAVIEAGIRRVVIARRDPGEVSRGGFEVLSKAGIDVELSDASPNATHLSDPFVHRVTTARPWVIAKWAQTIDGRIATRTGESQWISNARCRQRVHRLRAKVDAIMIGIGTAIADDPMLTARDCRHVRRIAKRVVLDTHGRLDHRSKLVKSAKEIPTIVCTSEPGKFVGTGCVTLETPVLETGLDLIYTLEQLGSKHNISTLLVEPGARVLGSLVDQDLIDEAIVHLAPGVIGDKEAKPVAGGRVVPNLSGMRRYTLIRTKQIESDIELHYRRDR